MTHLVRKHTHSVYGDVYIFEDDYISNIIARNGVWEDDICSLLAQHYIDGTDVIDIGANMGFNTILMNKKQTISQGCVFHMFEPRYDVFTVLEYNTRNLPRRLYNFALSDTSKMVHLEQFMFNKEGTLNVGATQVIDGKSDDSFKTHVLATTLDSIEFERKISIIKIDVECCEELVIRGGIGILQRDKPSILVESFPAYFGNVYRMLSDMGYKVVWNNNHDYLFRWDYIK